MHLVSNFPRSLLRELGEVATRKPYVAHVIYAALQLDDPPLDLDSYRHRLRTTGPIPRPRSRQLCAAIEEYGHPTVTATLAWLRSEYAARNMIFKTQGLYLTANMLRNCAHFREVLESRIQAPRHWESVTAALVTSGALSAKFYVESKGRRYAVFAF